jgi:hypothetical protein
VFFLEKPLYHILIFFGCIILVVPDLGRLWPYLQTLD